MSTLYHDNCSFSWYPVDVENSVRVRNSRLKNCDKKRTGIQTLRPGASTGNTAVGILALTVHYLYNLTPQLLCVGNDGPRTAMPVHCMFIRSMAVKYRFWMEDFCHSLFSQVIILVTLCLPNHFFATHLPSHRLVLVARKHDWIYWIIWIYCANGYWLDTGWILSSVTFCVWNPIVCQFEFIHIPVVLTCTLYDHTKYRHDLRLIYSVTNIK